MVLKCWSCFEQVSRDDEGDGTRRVELSGSDDAIAEAKDLINQILESDDRGGARQSYGMHTFFVFMLSFKRDQVYVFIGCLLVIVKT